MGRLRFTHRHLDEGKRAASRKVSEMMCNHVIMLTFARYYRSKAANKL